MKALILMALLLPFCTMAQVYKVPQSAAIDSVNIAKLEKEWGHNKQIPASIKKQALLALSFYPELKDVKIEFIMKKTTTPLTSRPGLLSVFRNPGKRIYMITISTETKPFIEPILLKNLSFDAQVGVLGHELSHVAFYIHKNTWQMLRIAFGMLSGTYTDKFENDTDKRSIEHGLGNALLAWSTDVRTKLNLKEWQGAKKLMKPDSRERYMKPESIVKYMQALPLYKN